MLFLSRLLTFFYKKLNGLHRYRRYFSYEFITYIGGLSFLDIL